MLAPLAGRSKLAQYSEQIKNTLWIMATLTQLYDFVTKTVDRFRGRSGKPIKAAIAVPVTSAELH
jgi:hypothetical protein